MTNRDSLNSFRISLGIFIVGLVLSGVTAFPLLHELKLLAALFGIETPQNYEQMSGISRWISYVYVGLEATYRAYPFIGYGTDLLAFGHITISLFFIPAMIDPRSSKPTLIVGLVACAGLIPLALICGAIREIPIYWRIIDISFGVFGALPLIYCLRVLKKLGQGAS